jgi:transcriptional regulator with XRE-family HTH domain
MTLTEWRKSRNLSLRAAGEVLGVSHVRVLQYERGDNSPRLSTVDRIERLTRGAVTRLDWPREGLERRSDAEMVALYGAACSRCGHGKGLHMPDGCNACCTCRVFAP